LGNESALKTFSCRHRERAMLLSRGDRQSREHLLKAEVSFVWFAVPTKKRHTGIIDSVMAPSSKVYCPSSTWPRKSPLGARTCAEMQFHNEFSQETRAVIWS